MRKIMCVLRNTGLLLSLLFVLKSVSAQTSTVKGTIKDNDGNPLAGASVIVEGKNIGTNTDVLGNYSLTLPAGRYAIVASLLDNLRSVCW